MAETASKQKLPFFTLLMYSLYGCPRFQVQTKISTIQPVFPEYFSISYEYDKNELSKQQDDKNFVRSTAYLMRKRWLIKAIKRKHQYWVQDSFIDKTDKQYNKFVPKPRMND